MRPTRLQRLVQLVRELSSEDDPDQLVRMLGREDDLLWRYDGLLILSSRELPVPQYRILRSWRWRAPVGTWAEPTERPVCEGGLLGELLTAGQPVILDQIEHAPAEPAAEHLEGMYSLAAAPGFDRGRAVGMVVLLRREPAAFTVKDLETLLLQANLIHQATLNMHLAQRLQEINRRLDEEMQKVGRMQQHLLPGELPRVRGLELGASYVTCREAGGDYYNLFPLPDDQWGLLVADVSGHGVPAAVVTAMLHTLLHAFPGPLLPPCRVLAHLNRHLLAMAPEGMFATAHYSVYDPHYRRLRYASAGHPPPRVRCCHGGIEVPDAASGLPLGILECETWTERTLTLTPGDVLLLHTDGILEGTSVAGEPFGARRLDDALRLGPLRAAALVRHIEREYEEFCQGVPDVDDRTLLAALAVP